MSRIKKKLAKRKKPEKPWVCDCCEKEQAFEEGKKALKLCPECSAEFEVWRHERLAKST